MQKLARLIRTLALTLPMALAPAWAYETDADFSDAELDRVLAPIALYPDTVLSHVLIAATYPLEIVAAARWSRRHPDLRGEDAVSAAADQDWDASVRALVAFPELLARMDKDLDWTQDLGDAFLAQEERVADRVQLLRRRAYDAGHLDSLDHVRVIHEPEVIYIEPAVTHLVYVPFYDTRVIYGSWWWPAYPPLYWGFPHGYYSGLWYWGVGYRVAPSFYFSSWYWPQRRVVTVHHVHHHHFRSGREVASHREAREWRHDAAHRRGVGYRHQRVRHEHASTQPAPRSRRHQADVSRPPSNRGDRHERERIEHRESAQRGLRAEPDHGRSATHESRGPQQRAERRERVDRPDAGGAQAHSEPRPEPRSRDESRAARPRAEREARTEQAPRARTERAVRSTSPGNQEQNAAAAVRSTSAGNREQDAAAAGARRSESGRDAARQGGREPGSKSKRPRDD